MTINKQNVAQDDSDLTEQTAEITQLLCQMLAENPKINKTILSNYNSELFWLKRNIAHKIISLRCTPLSNHFS